MAPRTRWLSAQGTMATVVQMLIGVLVVVAVVAIDSATTLPGPLLRPAFIFLCLILIAAAVQGFRWAVVLSLLSALGFSWLLPPRGSLKWNDSREAFAFGAFLVVAAIGSYLSNRARSQARRAMQSEQELRDVMDAIPAHVWRTASDGSVQFVNAGWQRYTGLPVDQALGWNWAAVLHPDDRARFTEEWRAALAARRRLESEVRTRRADGQYRWWFVRNLPRLDGGGNITGWYGGGFDIEDRRRAEALLAGENRILEMVARGEALPEILEALCLMVEGYADGALVSVLLLEGDRLRHGAAPNLPREYIKAVDGGAIGLCAGSCGTAAYRRERVIVEDIATDPLWADYRQLALPHSLRACWSTPIFASDGRVIATFAMYYHEPRSPSQEEQTMIQQVAHLAGIAIERKLIQEALRTSEGYLAEAQRVAHLGTWVWQMPKREIVYASDEWYRIYGFDPGVGPPSLKQRLDRLHPDDRSHYISVVDRAIQEQSDYEVEFRIVLPDGTMRYLRVMGHPVKSESGELVNFVGIAGDITERRQAEMALRAAMNERTRLSAFREEIGMALSRQEDLRGILHHCAEAVVRHLDAAFARIWTLSSDGRELELQASAGMYTHLDGFHSRIPVGKHKIGFIAHERKPHFTNDAQNDPRVSDREWARLEKMISFAGYPLVLEDRLVGVMGMFSQKPLAESTLEALSFAAGIIAQGIERRRAEEALRRSEAYLAEGQRLTHVGSWAVNVVARQALYSSPEHTRLFGFDPDKGTPAFEEFLHRVHPEDQQHLLETFQELTLSGGDLNMYYRIAVPGAPVRYMHAIGHPVRKQWGVSGEYVGTTIDITDRRQAEQERDRLHQLEADLAHMNRVTTMGELTASLAHEVNQPITAAMTSARTCVRWLNREEPDIARAREAAARVVAVTQRAAEIISRIRLLFRKSRPEWRRLDVNEVVTDIIALLQNETARHQISVRTELADHLPGILGDRVQLQQVLVNLTINSIEAMKDVEGFREIAFTSQRRADRQVLISVSDTGIGLPPEAEEVFSAFFTTKPEGTGMGLAISRSIVESHGGQLWATSNDGRGATFQFTLPVAIEADEHRQSIPASRQL